MKQTTKIIAIGAASLALVGGVSVGIATADPTSSPSPTASPSASVPTTKKADQKADQKRQGGRLIKRALHGEVTLAGKKHLDVVFQRGAVDKVSGSSITVTSKDGFAATYAVAETTKVRKDKASAAITDIAAKDKVRVVAVKTGDTVTARVIAERTK